MAKELWFVSWQMQEVFQISKAPDQFWGPLSPLFIGPHGCFV